ncbi:sulfolactate dehydrogenase [Novosphingobium sp. AAP83]|uniref:Ldh family oxidoreductase n=1 Tax=Novosphingobium sp. AAP83 TaxID=1523425 RepID=UPI0006B8971C|nr:Ldh family oxidoreductase [Novosphingobium sp. AAP83]KPF90626.1 sulfolactate dehydrogenase [Novosphingobium sp. AAP83]
MQRFQLNDLRERAASALISAGASPANAASVAMALVAAEAMGQTGHGLVRLHAYGAQVRAGKVDGAAVPTATRTRSGSAVIDAANGFAYPALDLAVKLLPELAKDAGIGAVAITRSHHCGAAGLPVRALAEQGLIALMFANTPAAMAPWGGSRPMFGTNPIAFACPHASGVPLVIDLSLSKVARGKIVAAQNEGRSIPSDWAFDAAGRPTTNPRDALGGTMAPAGEAKGAVLALMVEILAAGLCNANFGVKASSFLDAEGPPPGTGQLLLAIDPFAFGGTAALSHIADFLNMMSEMDGVRIPGQSRAEALCRAEADGLDLSDSAVANLQCM